MDTETLPNVTKTFKYSFPTCTNEDVLFKLEVPVEIPHSGSTRELVQRVIKMFHIPVYLEDELNERLANFVAEETKTFHNERDEKLLNQLKNSELNVEGIVRNWEKLFKENVVDFAEQKGTPDEEVFAAAYHKLVHSPALETILQVENSYAKTVKDTLKNRDEDIKKLTDSQTEEMEEKMKLLHVDCTEEEINQLVSRHLEQQIVVAGRWGSTLDALAHTQRAQHRAWLMSTLDQYHDSSALTTPSNSPLGTFSPAVGAALGGPPAPLSMAPAAQGRMEESFTIHLGSQLKQTHNIRIVAMDLLDLCNVDPDNPTESSRRLQTSLSLYSSELSGVVLLSESPPSPRLAAAATGSTEYHFCDLDRQMRQIDEQVKEPAEDRNAARRGSQPAGHGGGSRKTLRAGDVVMTRHSNLGDVHVVFHLVVDDHSLKSGDITSRHPAILGLRNVLKAACSNDVTSISLPLLLRHELSEEMTGAWCARRAELVLKCVKGFVLEAAGAGGAELRTLHFALPPAIDARVFASLATLLPTIFRISNPLKFKAAG
ncbi:hypothetical protein O3G_MSEX003306 [Manduca sexta]|uniref:Uncharacterized protein n=1 Tax=Manduca sexta TaxID=7130 RepID=A0A922CFD2_MANSE|nr:hypothetical protein O3G_MSEX003306 [Manduca sexta]